MGGLGRGGCGNLGGQLKPLKKGWAKNIPGELFQGGTKSPRGMII